MTRPQRKKMSGRTAWKIHPGEILREEFPKPLKMSSYELAKKLRVPRLESTTSFLKSAGFLRTRQFDSPSFSAPQKVSG